jgi:hypothetical protein
MNPFLVSVKKRHQNDFKKGNEIKKYDFTVQKKCSARLIAENVRISTYAVLFRLWVRFPEHLNPLSVGILLRQARRNNDIQVIKKRLKKSMKMVSQSFFQKIRKNTQIARDVQETFSFIKTVIFNSKHVN